MCEPQDCPPGSYQICIGKTTCDMCPPGRFCPDVLTATICPAGFVCSSWGSTAAVELSPAVPRRVLLPHREQGAEALPRRLLLPDGSVGEHHMPRRDVLPQWVVERDGVSPGVGVQVGLNRADRTVTESWSNSNHDNFYLAQIFLPRDSVRSCSTAQIKMYMPLSTSSVQFQI